MHTDTERKAHLQGVGPCIKPTYSLLYLIHSHSAFSGFTDNLIQVFQDVVSEKFLLSSFHRRFKDADHALSLFSESRFNALPNETFFSPVWETLATIPLKFHQIQDLFVARNRRGLWAGPKH